jgi:hypothetical protein
MFIKRLVSIVLIWVLIANTIPSSAMGFSLQISFPSSCLFQSEALAGRPINQMHSIGAVPATTGRLLREMLDITRSGTRRLHMPDELRDASLIDDEFRGGIHEAYVKAGKEKRWSVLGSRADISAMDASENLAEESKRALSWLGHVRPDMDPRLDTCFFSRSELFFSGIGYAIRRGAVGLLPRRLLRRMTWLIPFGVMDYNEVLQDVSIVYFEEDKPGLDQVSWCSSLENTIYIGRRLAEALTKEQLAGLFARKLVELAAKKDAREKRLEWLPLVDRVGRISKAIEIRIAGAGRAAGSSSVDAIAERLGGPEASDARQVASGPPASVAAPSSGRSDWIKNLTVRGGEIFKSRLEPASDLSPANAFLFLLAKSFGLKGWAAVNLGILSVILESLVGFLVVSHVQNILPVSWFHWGPGWIVGPSYVFISAFFAAAIYLLVEHRDLSGRPFSWSRWGLNFWWKGLQSLNLWIRFRVFAWYSLLAIPILHDFHHLPLIALGSVINAYHAVGAIRTFRRELAPYPVEDASSRGVALGKAIREAEAAEEHNGDGKELLIILLDMDDLAAYGVRLGVHGRDIINHVLMKLLWDKYEGVIARKFGPHMVMFNVGGDETYLCLQVPSGSSDEAMENIRRQLEELRRDLKERSEEVFQQLDRAFRIQDARESEEALPDMFKGVPSDWIDALRNAIQENGALPPLTLTGGLVSFTELKKRIPDTIREASPRTLFSLLRAVLMEPVNKAKEAKRDYAPGVEHIRVASLDGLPTIYRAETLFNPSVVAGLHPSEREFLFLRDPRRPFPGLNNIPVKGPIETQFREFDRWKKQLSAAHRAAPGKAIIGSIRHSYGGSSLLATLRKMAEEAGPRTTRTWRGGAKAVNGWDQTISALDLLIAYEHMELLKSLNEQLGRLPGFKPGQLTVTVHPHSPDTLFIAWIPGPGASLNPLDDFKPVFAAALARYQERVDAALVHTLSNAEQEIKVYPQVALLQTEDPEKDLDDLSLRKIQDLVDDSPGKPAIEALFASPVRATDPLHSIKMVFVDRITDALERAAAAIEKERKDLAQGVLKLRVEAENAARALTADPHSHLRLQEAA